MNALWIEGYTDAVSYRPRDRVNLSVSTSAEKFEIRVSRLGAQSESVLRKGDILGKEHPIPEDASAQGCRWPSSFSFAIPDGWRSGYYQIDLIATGGGEEFVRRGRRSAESSCFFVLRPASPGRDNRILLQLSTNTYNAYNNWGGGSLYAYNGRNGVQGRRVSFERPPGSQFGSWEHPFVRWAEGAGFALDYAANLDLEFHPEMLGNYRLILSVGHDEYWSRGMRDNLESFIGSGGNVAFFSGNTCCWQVRPEAGGKQLVCWKQAYKQDPLFGSGHDEILSSLWSHHLVKRPENQLTGVGFLWGGYHLSHGQLMDGSGAFTVHHPEHWIFEGTGLKRGDTFGGKDTIVGYECDGCQFKLRDGLPVPTHRDGTPKNFSILASAPAIWAPDDCEWYDRWEKGRVGASTLGTYTREGTVFTAATTDWSHGLAGGDPHVDRITRNILRRLSI